jgi:two-component system, LytTR family, response regulator
VNVEMPILRALIVDDEPFARDALRSALEGHEDVQVIGECANGLDAIKMIRDSRPDVVFLDVQMPEIDGFGVVMGVGVDDMPPVVMVTAHDRFAIQAFDVHAVDYLLKPYTSARLAEALKRVQSMIARGKEGSTVHPVKSASVTGQMAESDDVGDGNAAVRSSGYATRLLVKRGDHLHFVPVATVDYFEADGSYVKLHVGKDKHRVRRTMKDLEAQLDPRRFVRVHRSTIVNIERIKEVQPWFNGDYVALLIGGEQVRVSRVYRDHLLRPQF